MITTEAKGKQQKESAFFFSRMATIMRKRKAPPSPIPTGKGLRSAADHIFSDYIDKSIHIPELTLPEYVHRLIPADIDYHSLVSREDDSVVKHRLLRSAFQFGVFRISGLRIAATEEELRSELSAESEWMFHDTEGRESVYHRHSGDREEFVWHRSSDKTEEATADETYGTFRQRMDNVASKLETVAELVSQVIAEGASKRFSEDISTNKSILSLYRYNQHSLMDQDPPLSPQKIKESFEYALSLHLMIEHCEFHVQSERGHLSFNTSPDSIVVTLGKQLEEWSHGKFKSASGVLLFEPNLNKTQPSFSIELKYTLSNSNQSPPRKIHKTISIADQILIILIVIFLYKFFYVISF